MFNRMLSRVEEMKPLFEATQWEDPLVYATWLSQAYALVSRSVPFLGLCYAHSDQYPQFKERCLEHISEEKGHERLIENDLKALGFPLQREFESTMLLHRVQYFEIVKNNPMSFLGYIFLLEILGPKYGPILLERVENKKALSFMKVHIADDEDHLISAQKILASTHQPVQEAIWSNFQMSALAYEMMLKDLTSMSSRHSKAA